mgnify:CR=1 FL=1
MANQKPVVENKDGKLNPFLYAIYDRVFMHYGSTLNGLQNALTEKNWKEIVMEAWQLSQNEVENMVSRLYAENEIPTIQEGQEKPL